MNKFIAVARLTRNAELTYAQGSGMAIAKFGIAVNRTFKREGQPDADFFNVTIFGKKAEAVANYTHKGSLISLSGSIQTGSYTNKDGNKKYTVDVIADEVNFLDSKNKVAESVAEEVTPVDDVDMPF